MSRRALAFVLGLGLGLPSPAAAQFVTSFGATAATVRYDGLSTGGALTLAPRAEWRTPGATLLVSGAFAVHEIGDYSFQGGPRFYAVSEPVMGPFRFGMDAGLDGTARSGAMWTASADAVAEAVWLGWREGFAAGMGLVTGGLKDHGPVSAGRLRVRAWSAWERFEGLASVEPVWLPDATYTDFAVRGGVIGARWEALGALFYRAGSGIDSRGAVQAALRWYVAPVSAIELGLGSYLADPVQGLPAGRYATLGVRFFDRRERTPPLTPVGRGVFEVGSAGVVLEFRFPGVSTVEIAGDWNGWVPVPMQDVGPGLWRAVLALEPGVYHFNVRLDRARWVVPGGIPQLDDGFGGKQGVLVVR